LLRGGGVTFGPEPRSFEAKVPKKVRRLALKMALSEKFKNHQLVVLDQFELDEIKTKAFIAVMQNLDIQSVLIVTDQKNETLELSSRNVQNVKVLRSEGLNVYDLLKYEKVVLLEPALKAIEGRLLA
jgi:large subunit ribosomal protein L4